MIEQLAVGTVMVLLTVAIHGAGLAMLRHVLHLEMSEERHAHVGPLSRRAMLFTMALVLGLVALHGVEIWTYASVYLALGALADLPTAVYFSTITYATIGFDDEGIQTSWRLVAAIEGINGINGIILLGWSTAFFVTVMNRLGRP